jgi:hypothetical protein
VFELEVGLFLDALLFGFFLHLIESLELGIDVELGVTRKLRPATRAPSSLDDSVRDTTDIQQLGSISRSGRRIVGHG